MTASEAGQVKSWLRTNYHVIAPDDWLQACIEWLHEEDTTGGLLVSQLCSQVLEQWLVCDLREIGATCLPEQATNAQKFQLTGNYALQVEKVVDVSSPYYGQLQKVQGTENANVLVSATQVTQFEKPWETKGSRLLMMDMTDGTHNIKGMEYNLIRDLQPNITPGTKVVVKGSVLCRLGVMMLTGGNVQVLGGEVEGLIEENRQLNVLTRALNAENLPRENPSVHFDPPSNPTQAPTQNTRTNGRNNSGNITSSIRNGQLTSQFPQGRPAHGNSNNQCVQSFGGSDSAMEIPDDDILDHMDTDAMEAMVDEWEDDMDDGALLEVAEFEELSQSQVPAASYSNKAPRNTPSMTPPVPRSASSHRSQANTSTTAALNNSSSRGQYNSTASAFASQGNRNMSVGNQTARVKSKTPGVQFEAPKSNPERPKLSVSGSFEKAAHKSSPLANQMKLDSFFVRPRAQPFARPAVPKQEGDEEEESQSLLPQEPSGSSSHRQNSTARNQVAARSQPLKKPLFSKNSSPTGGQSSGLSVSSVYSSGEQGCTTHRAAKRLKQEPAELGLDTRPYTYLSKVLAAGPEEHTTVRVKAFISTFRDKLDNNNGTKWTLQVRINDGTAAIDVDLSDKMLSGLIGFSAPECKMMKTQVKANPAYKKKLINGMKLCQKTLVELSCIMEVEFGADLERPCVHQIIDCSKQDLAYLKQRAGYS